MLWIIIICAYLQYFNAQLLYVFMYLRGQWPTLWGIIHEHVMYTHYVDEINQNDFLSNLSFIFWTYLKFHVRHTFSQQIRFFCWYASSGGIELLCVLHIMEFSTSWTGKCDCSWKYLCFFPFSLYDWIRGFSSLNSVVGFPKRTL